MLATQFIPSRMIALYTGRLFLWRSLAVLAALVLILQTLDLLSESGDVLAYPGNGQAQLLYYVSLRAPQIIARFLPFSVLLGALITLATLNQNSEVVIFKSAGISAHQILAPLILVSLGFALVSLAFNERVLVRANAALDAWQAVDYAHVPPPSGTVPNVWVRNGDDLIHVDRVTGRGAATRLEGITIYDRTGGALDGIIRGQRAYPSGNAWVLDGVRHFEVASGDERTLPRLQFGEGIGADRFTLADVNPDEKSLIPLAAAITDLRAAGRPTANLETSFWHKLSGPLSTILMPLLGSVAAFGLARTGRLFIRTVIGMGLGFAYFVSDNVGVAMGNFGSYPPFLAAWSPFLLFFLIGEIVLIRTEE
jgi:lipopolysaccharide export system permease protein